MQNGSSDSPITRRAFVATTLAATAAAQTPATLPGTGPLTTEGDLTERSMDGAHRFVERKIRESLVTRQRHWKRDLSSPAAYAQSIAPNRKRFLEKIGVVDQRVEPALENFATNLYSSTISDTPDYRIYQVRWQVLEGVTAEGLQFEPKNPIAQIVLIGDADDSIEQVSRESAATSLAQRGCRILIPTLIDRSQKFSGHPEIRMTDQTHREWIYRQAFHMGRHIIGYEVQKVLAAVDWFLRQAPQLPVGVAGQGEGGLIAFYAAASDPRIQSALIGGYFQSRENTWSQPIYRNVWGLLEEFGDAEIASLIAPRPFIVSLGKYPEVHNQKGDLKPPDKDEVEAEFSRIQTLVPDSLQRRIFLDDFAGATINFLQILTKQALSDAPLAVSGGMVSERPFNPAEQARQTARQQRQVRELENHVQDLVRKSEEVRSRFYLLKAAPEFQNEAWNTKQSFPSLSPTNFVAASEEYRRQFWEDVMGKFDEPYAPVIARSRKTRETDKWIGYEVAYDVWPDFTAWGALLLPKNLRPGERRPVVVCQHGRQGRPWDTVDGDNAYNHFAANLADRGFIVFSPQNLYIFEDRYRWLSRKANGIKASLFSVTLGQHEQLLRWLATLPFVDASRIAFYGLSYGGESAMRLPAALKGYCLSICSGDFNQWAWKVASTDERFSFMYTIEWEMPYFNMGNTFDYAEMAYLIFPRPFFVERGHNDRVGRDRWVSYEYAKVRYLYTQFGLADRTGIEFFNGGHAIHGVGTFDFLHRHLDFPARP